MQHFDQLGDEIQEQWKAVGFDPLRFSEVAVAALTRWPPASLLDWRQVAEAFLDYHALGVTTFLIRGFDPLEDALDYGRELIPRTRALVAERLAETTRQAA